MRLDHICAGTDTIQLYIVYTIYSIVRFQLRYLNYYIQLITIKLIFLELGLNLNVSCLTIRIF